MNILSPLAAGIIDRLTRGESVKAAERNFILLYSIAQNLNELRDDVGNIDEAICNLTRLANELRVETALVRGRLDK